jgi:DNA-binding GntR family transcriptional regulator
MESNDDRLTSRRALDTVSGLPSFDPLDRATLQEQAYQQLRRAVMGGVFSPGTVITIRAAADALGVSPMPVRAALGRLESEGALIARGSKRTMEIPALTHEEYRELRDIRIVLEGLAAERAVSNITPDELQAVERNCEAMQAAAEAGDLAAYTQANWAFHLSVYRASRMEVLVGMIESLWLRVGPYVKFMLPDRQSLLASMPDHWRALEALQKKSGAGARKAVGEDISHCAVNLLKVLAPRR